MILLYFVSKGDPAKVHDYLCAWSTLRAVICGHGNTKITVQVEATPPPGCEHFGSVNERSSNWRKFCRYMFVYVRQLGWFYWNWSNVLVSCGLIKVYSYTSSLQTVRIHCSNLDLCLYFVRYPRQLPCGSYSRILRSAQALCFDWLLLSGTASTPLGIYD